DGPFRQVARVNDLHWIGWTTRRQDLAAAFDANWPVGESIRLVTGTDDVSGTNYEGLSGKPFFSFSFRLSFQRPKQRKVAGAHGRARFLHSIGAGVFYERCGFVHALLTRIGINSGRRNVDVTFGVTFQDLSRIAHPDRQGRRIVDHDVPGSAF